MGNELIAKIKAMFAAAPGSPAYEAGYNSYLTGAPCGYPAQSKEAAEWTAGRAFAIEGAAW